MNDGGQQETPRRLRRAEELPVTISIAAEMVHVHAQTLRHYERIGLIASKRSEGKIRYYTLEDIERLDMIKHLMEQEDVNLAGVKAVLRLQQQVENMRTDYERQVEEQRDSSVAECARWK